MAAVVPPHVSAIPAPLQANARAHTLGRSAMLELMAEGGGETTYALNLYLLLALDRGLCRVVASTRGAFLDFMAEESLEVEEGFLEENGYVGIQENPSSSLGAFLWCLDSSPVVAEKAVQTVYGVHADLDSTAVYYRVADDFGRPRDVVLHAVTYGSHFVPGNNLRWLASQGVDPSRASIYLQLPNARTVEISWWDVVPIPGDPFIRQLVFIIHSRGWRQPTEHIIRPIPTVQSVEGIFYNLNSLHFQAALTLPVLQGGWVLLSYHRQLLRQVGFVIPRDAFLVRSCPENLACLLETSLNDAIPVPPEGNISIVWRVVCTRCFDINPTLAYHATNHHC
ncbi:hypothetical protein BD626DRAFT_570873 [Schizophyllum amplum]|uniref:Uncharacterized protein n=1 Tax=Schizophyllum amplum TaxID=97359 RepID=A0A550C8S9_9AGAR|nr:hypothetical protein BD626DRAFT_570873 [Auriculariopsis ampla]